MLYNTLDFLCLSKYSNVVLPSDCLAVVVGVENTLRTWLCCFASCLLSPDYLSRNRYSSEHRWAVLVFGMILHYCIILYNIWFE